MSLPVIILRPSIDLEMHSSPLYHCVDDELNRMNSCKGENEGKKDNE